MDPNDTYTFACVGSFICVALAAWIFDLVRRRL